MTPSLDPSISIFSQSQEPTVDKFKDIADEALATQREAKFAAFQTLLALDAPSPAQVDEAKALAAEVDEHDAEIKAREEAAAKAANDFAELKERKFGAEASETEPEEEAPAEEPAEEEAVEPEAEAVAEEPAAAQAAKGKTVATLAAKTRRPAAPAAQPERHLSIVAAADNGYAAGTQMTLDDIGRAAINRLSGMAPPEGDGKTEDLRKFSVASIELPFDPDLVIDRGTDEMTVLYRAADETRLPEKSLVASNGWCSPSETMYDLSGFDESLEGILSVPEVQIKRGGMRYTMGPQFSDFYSNAGFIQTEAQAISGTTKPCYEVTCPSFTDVRLDAVGLCIKVPILLNAAYPEMTNRFVSGTTVAHAHMVNASVIGRMVTLSGAARDATSSGLGSTASDTLQVLLIVAAQRRQAYRLAFNTAMEVVVPFWVKDAIKVDLGRRMGVGADAITDADVNAQFSAANLRVSFVYDWQVLNASVLQFPTSFQALIYPAGTFIKGVSQVINLSAVYDAASLAVNTYTGLFMEQGLLVAKVKYASDLVTLPVCSTGRVGAANFTTCV